MSCQSAFHSLLESSTLAAPATEPIPAYSEVAPPEAPLPSVAAVPASLPDVPAVASMAAVAPISPANAPVEPAPMVQEQQQQLQQQPASPAEPFKAAPQTATAVDKPVARPNPPAQKPVRSTTKTALSAPPPHQNRGRSIGMAAAVVVVAALGFPLGKYWFAGQQFLAAPPPEDPPQTAPAAQKVVERRSTSAARPSAPISAAPPTTREGNDAPSVNRASVQASRTSAKPQPKPVRPATPPVRPAVAASSAPTPAAPVTEPPPPPVVAAAPPPVEEPSAPLGPLYEANQVNEAPKITSRVEPQMPEDLRDRSISDVVVVRVLVSQTGHPSTINLLRRSRAGRTMDDAVVAAVKRWKFAPARKRGEAVSCWYNIGVPIGKAE